MAKTQNPNFGFYGTIQHYGHDADTAWDMAVDAIVAFFPAMNPRIAARKAAVFLDSAGGRHLADAVAQRLHPAGFQRTLPSFASWMA